MKNTINNYRKEENKGRKNYEKTNNNNNKYFNEP